MMNFNLEHNSNSEDSSYNYSEDSSYDVDNLLNTINELQSENINNQGFFDHPKIKQYALDNYHKNLKNLKEKFLILYVNQDEYVEYFIHNLFLFIKQKIAMQKRSIIGFIDKMKREQLIKDYNINRIHADEICSFINVEENKTINEELEIISDIISKIYNDIHLLHQGFTNILSCNVKGLECTLIIAKNDLNNQMERNDNVVRMKALMVNRMYDITICSNMIKNIQNNIFENVIKIKISIEVFSREYMEFMQELMPNIQKFIIKCNAKYIHIPRINVSVVFEESMNLTANNVFGHMRIVRFTMPINYDPCTCDKYILDPSLLSRYNCMNHVNRKSLMNLNDIQLLLYMFKNCLKIDARSFVFISDDLKINPIMKKLSNKFINFI